MTVTTGGRRAAPGPAVAIAAAVGSLGAFVIVGMLLAFYLVASFSVALLDAVTGGDHPGDGWAFARWAAPYPLACVALSCLVAWLWARSPGAGAVSRWLIGIVSGLAGFVLTAGWLLAT
jgi:hypothetical protein